MPAQTVEAIYKQQFQKAMGDLDGKYQHAIEQVQVEPQRQLALLKQQASIDWKTIHDDRSADWESKKKKAAALDARYQKQVLAIKSKQAPTSQTLRQAYEQQKRDMQAQFKAQADSDAQLVRLGQEGKLDPAEVMAERWSKALGRSIPASAFRGKAGTVEQRKSALKRDIQNITTFLERFEGSGRVGFLRGALTLAKRGQARHVYTDPTTDVERVLDPDVGEDAVLINNRRKFTSVLKKKEREFGQLLVGGNPAIQAAVKKNERRQHAIKILAGTDKQGGGIGPSFESILANNPRTKDTLPPAAETVKSLAAQGLSREQIREQMEALGYK